MSRAIGKYAIEVDDQLHDIEMPEGAKIIEVAKQGEGYNVTFWAEVYDDPDVRKETRTFVTVGTGHPVPGGAVYVGSVHADPFVWHLYERP